MRSQGQQGYGSPRAVDQAIKAAARQHVQKHPGSDVNVLIRQAYFERLLSRVFSEGEESGWVLKGGTGMLARIPRSRGTRDIDLLKSGQGIEDAVEALQTIVETTDLGDHIRFTLSEVKVSVAGQEQEYTDGRKLIFDVHLGAVRLGEKISVDLVVGPDPVGPVESLEPLSKLDLPKLVSFPFLLYPVADHIADKVCATAATYNGQPSTREKDLVDLALFAWTVEGLQAQLLTKAIDNERRKRGLPTFNEFSIPSGWGSAYRKMAVKTALKDEFADVDTAYSLVKDFINPVLSSNAQGIWDPQERIWG